MAPYDLIGRCQQFLRNLLFLSSVVEEVFFSWEMVYFFGKQWCMSTEFCSVTPQKRVISHFLLSIHILHFGFL